MLLTLQVTAIPSWLGSAWGISEVVAAIILSLVVLLAVMLPVFILTRGRNAVTMQLFFFFLTLTGLVGIGWAPFWLLVVMLLLTSLAFALVGSKAIGG